MAITNTDFQNIALAISAYSDEAYTEARKLNSTGILEMTGDELLEMARKGKLGSFGY